MCTIDFKIVAPVRGPYPWASRKANPRPCFLHLSSIWLKIHFLRPTPLLLLWLSLFRDLAKAKHAVSQH